MAPGQVASDPPASSPGRPTFAAIDHGALAWNSRRLSRYVAHGTRQLAVIKADAYGHGAVGVARTLVEAGVWGLAVSLVEEGTALRRAGVRAPVVVLGGVYPGLEEEVVAHGLTPVVWTVGQLEALAGAVRRGGAGRCRIHLKIDTGMSRLGMLPRELPAVVDSYLARHADVLEIEGVMTHLACADEDDDSTTRAQVADFLAACEQLASVGVRPALRHVCNSAGIVSAAQAHLDLVRPGIALYGAAAAPEVLIEGLRPAMSMFARVAGLRTLDAGTAVSYGHRARLRRPSTLAIVPVGYEDGYMRRMSGRAEVLIGGARCAVVGNITMDTIMVDVTERFLAGQEVAVGEPVVLLGAQGGDRITVFELAAWAGVIPYEVLCGISKRVPRR